ncbi:MAG: beta-propeller fold lactonase family protein, partial [Terriglobales bacterium]
RYTAPMRRFLAHVAILLGFGLALASAPAQAPCRGPLGKKTEFVGLPGKPFEPIFSRDGCTVFVSLTPQGEIAVLRRKGKSFHLDRVVRPGGHPTGMVLTHDGRTLIAADGDAVDLLDAAVLQTGQGDPVRARLGAGRLRAAIYVNVTADDHYLLVSNENGAAVTVFDLRSSALLGEVPTGVAPIALTLSPDGRWLFMTSELAPPALHWPRACAPQAAAGRGGAPVMPEGVVQVADMAKVISDPTHAVVSTVAAGCSPVRLALSPDGAIAYVTARTDDRVLAFDTAKLTANLPEPRLGSVPVGTAPVGIAVTPDGGWVIATNSNRFAGLRGGRGGGGSDLDAIAASSFVPGSAGAAPLRQVRIPAGGFPRELRFSPDGALLAVTNFQSNQLELVDLARALPR